MGKVWKSMGNYGKVGESWSEGGGAERPRTGYVCLGRVSGGGAPAASAVSQRPGPGPGRSKRQLTYNSAHFAKSRPFRSISANGGPKAPRGGTCAPFLDTITGISGVPSHRAARGRNRAHWRKCCQFGAISPISPKMAKSGPGWLKQASSPKNSDGFCWYGRQ